MVTPVKSAPTPSLPLHHPCPLLLMCVLSHSYSPPTSESLHTITVEHHLMNHIWNFKHYLKFPPAPTWYLTSASAHLKRFVFSPHLHTASSLCPCPGSCLVCQSGQSRARPRSLTDPHGRLTFCYLLNRMEREWCELGVGGGEMILIAGGLCGGAVATWMKCFHSNGAPPPSCGQRKALHTK